MATMNDIVQGVMERLSMYSGLDTQIYAQDRIQAIVQEKFYTLFDVIFWPQFTTYGGAFTLDGTLGVVTADISSMLTRFEDIHSIWYESDEHPLPRAPDNVNPRNIRLRSVQPYNADNKVFRVLPATTTGAITMTYRTRPAPYNLDDEILFDETLLKLSACYDYLEDDASNPTAAEKFQELADNRMRQLLKNLQQIDISTQRYTSPEAFGEWY